VSGQWDFNADNSAGLMAATIGSDLQSRVDQLFSSPEIDLINGEQASLMRFIPDATAGGGNGYVMCHGALPNGGGTRVNQFSLIMDIKYPSSSTGFRSLWQTDTNNPTQSDGDLFVNGGNGIGISSVYQGSLTPDTWHRVVFTFDLTKRELGKYIDGTNVLSGPVGSTPPPGAGPYQYLSTSSGVVDNRWSLDNNAVLFSDEDGELAEGLVNSVQFRVGVLSAAEVAILGGPTAAGIPVTIEPLPPITYQRDEVGLITLSWPARYSSFTLEETTELGPGVIWTPAVEQIDNQATIDPGGSARFFRLRK
jgi:hypothetical protein